LNGNSCSSLVSKEYNAMQRSPTEGPLQRQSECWVFVFERERERLHTAEMVSEHMPDVPFVQTHT
jgi:hypothetical protein